MKYESRCLERNPERVRWTSEEELILKSCIQYRISYQEVNLVASGLKFPKFFSSRQELIISRLPNNAGSIGSTI